MAMWVIKKNKRYVMDDDLACSFTKNINKASRYSHKRDAVALLLANEHVVRVKKNKQDNLVEVN